MIALQLLCAGCGRVTGFSVDGEVYADARAYCRSCVMLGKAVGGNTVIIHMQKLLVLP